LPGWKSPWTNDSRNRKWPIPQTCQEGRTRSPRVLLDPPAAWCPAKGTLSSTICKQWGTDAQRRSQSYQQACWQPRAHAATHA
jgi:hypothetical protein